MSLLGKDTFFSGTFSMAGRDSAEKFNINAEANKVEEKEKNKVFKYFFSPDIEWENKQEDIDDDKILKECNININDIKKDIKFSLDYIRKKQLQSTEDSIIKKQNSNSNKKKDNKNKKKKNKKLFRKIFQGFKYKYHNIHLAKLERYKKEGIIQQMNIQQEPIYNPKMDYIYQKLSIGPPWSKLSGRRKNLFEQENYITNLSYNENYSSLNNIKGFIDMAKQTQRNGFPLNGDIRQRCEKKFVPVNFKKIVNSKFYKTATVQKNAFSPFKFANILNDKKDNEDLIQPFSENRTSRNRHKHATLFKIKEEPEIDKFKLIRRNQSVPDFNSYLSREKLNKLDNLLKKNDRITNEVLFPNYKTIEERVKMMVIYSKNTYNKLKNNKKEFKGMSSDEVYNANETFEKIYGNKIRAVPLFKKMTSRPDDNDLPFFLNGITNRLSYYFTSDKSLKMNNYSNRKLYNLRNEFNGNKDKYKNYHLDAVRKSLGFDGNSHYDKNKINKELEISSKKFNDLIVNNNI